jgi:hypothetical protein
VVSLTPAFERSYLNSAQQYAGLDQPQRQFAGDSDLDTITCGSKVADCAARVLVFRGDSPLKYVRGELRNPGDSGFLITVKHRNKSVFFAAKSWRIRQLATKTLLFASWRKYWIDEEFNKSLFLRG